MAKSQRTHDRTKCPGATAAWGHSTGGALNPARLVDESATGVAIETTPGETPQAGDRIRVLTRKSHGTRHAIVVRVASSRRDDKRSSTLGCRWTTREDRRRAAGLVHIHPSHFVLKERES